jgi:hypothetical protein
VADVIVGPPEPGVTIRFDGPSAAPPPSPHVEIDGLDAAVPPIMLTGEVAPSPYSEVATLAMAGLAARVAALDPNLLWMLASAIASIVQACAQGHLTAVLRRVKSRPDGWLAARVYHDLARKLPAEWGDASGDIAAALIAAGTEAVDDPDLVARVFAGHPAAAPG